mmetsp:Transcript_17850/g.25417  ORF Transcript_17850/g.25417 Transcript_17850/m.25417 type:complete len:142 (+) Transcript_17850:210-635(+)
MGADINASIGSRTSNNDERDNNPNNNIEETTALSPQDLLIGPCANPRTNHKGHLYIDLLSQLDLRAASTYFQNDSGYDTLINPGSNARKIPTRPFPNPKKALQISKKCKENLPWNNKRSSSHPNLTQSQKGQIQELHSSKN